MPASFSFFSSSCCFDIRKQQHACVYSSSYSPCHLRIIILCRYGIYYSFPFIWDLYLLLASLRIAFYRQEFNFPSCQRQIQKSQGWRCYFLICILPFCASLKNISSLSLFFFSLLFSLSLHFLRILE